MLFITRIKLTLYPGKGGNGSNSYFGKFKKCFDGGNGGKGGDIILQRSEKHETLNHIVNYNVKAENGQNGSRNNQKGKYGKNTILYLSRQCKITFLTQYDLYLQNYEINENNKFITINGTNGGIGSVNSKNKNNISCYSENSNVYKVIVQSFFDNNSIAIIFFPHISCELNNFFHNKYSSKKIYIEYKKNNKIYIFTFFDKNIIYSINSFKIVAFIYSDNQSRNQLKDKLNNVNGNIILIHIKNINAFIDSI